MGDSGTTQGGARYPWLWDVDIDNLDFDRILSGTESREDMDQSWALLRLIEYAPFRDIKRLLPRSDFLRLWPRVSARVRSPSRRKGMDFVAAWLEASRAPRS